MGADEAIAESKARLESMLAPINGGVGEDASYDELFEAIKTEIDKVNAIEGGTTDWSVVQGNSETLLAEKSKDFRIALYWGVAAFRKPTVTTILDAVVLLLELCNQYWEPMYPALKRPRARGALCAWYSEVGTPLVQSTTVTAKDKDAAQAANRVFRELDGLLAERLGEAYPGMNTLRDQIAALERRVPVEAPPPAPPPPPPSKQQAAAPAPTESGFEASSDTSPPVDYSASYGGGGGGMGLSTADIVDADSAYRALAECAPLIGRASDVFLSLNPTGADGFRLGRVAAWLLVGGTPYNEGGNTQVDGPGEHIVQALIEQANAQDWTSLLATASQAAADYPLSLDAAMGLALALENLGPDYEQAKTAVVRETAALLARAPELPNLKFSNGLPFATPQAKEWAAALSAGGGGGGGGAKSPVDKAVVEAEKLVAAEQVPQAVALLSRLASQLGSPMLRFKARLEIAKIALRAQLMEIAAAQLESLEALAEQHKLAAWDPDLCADLYAQIYKSRKAATQFNMEDQDLIRRANQAFQRLCELDAALALKVSSELAGM